MALEEPGNRGLKCIQNDTVTNEMKQNEVDFLLKQDQQSSSLNLQAPEAI